MKGVLAHGIEMKVELILIDLIEVTLDVIVVLQGQAEVVLSEVGGATFCLKPHTLHVVDVEALVVTWVFAESCHCGLS